ncbi:DNA excision repair protein [Cordyceps fumosorosea ARSEF 2679]|uniref:DNA excision repair protein n=1 Tax=Cordyceps fumosorosea (strain ARSEF 2679) TaxID=1081104 RepID=A0A167VVN7_CORFA|nr:DNA excision repair protein [Cordyceps fumosorosea ARSEF 2679]OAA63029.1 DNA excision repair protein [Cordyceps fumosorosea ARSEF 2679]
MAPATSATPIVILDSDDDDLGSNLKSDIDIKEEERKRKAEPSFSEKVEWTDESDSVPVAKPKKKRAKRKSAPKRRSTGAGRPATDADDVVLDDDWQPELPDYLIERRQQFDTDRKKHHEAALMLPPDYTSIDLGDKNGIKNFNERPVFPASSGIRPVRAYEVIELPQSAGLIPASIAQYLRDYQIEGVKFLHRKFVYQEGGVLGDDMGLGKTVQVVAFLTAAFGKTGDERDNRRMRQIRWCSTDRWYPRILIICPGSLLINWKNELDRWGWWHAEIYHGPNKDDILGTMRAGMSEIMITTYDTYKNSRSAVNMVQWDAVIADECHKLKGHNSETTKAMNEINALCRIGLTGTAIQNKYEELWTLLDWTNPGNFGTRAEWSQTISKPLAVGQSHEATLAQLSLARQTAQKLVTNLLPRYFLRRMKSLIADQLPKKTDRVVFCPLTDLQKQAYDNFLESDDVSVIRNISETCQHDKKLGWCCGRYLSDGRTWQSAVFPSMMSLQKLSNHMTLLVPSATDLEGKQSSELNTLKICMPDRWQTLYAQRDQIGNLVNPEFCGKWKVMKKLLKFWHSNGDKVLVFSHSVRLLRILQHLFTNTSYTVSYLDGSLSYEQRQEVVDTFNSDPTQFVFLISTRAGGVGLNITSANKVVIVDPHWNPSYDLQAQDRAYRIGQTRDVEVFRLISLGTVEEIVYARQVYKQQQANIGYTASSERRYFRGVQQDADRKGEIFGLSNIFTFHSDSGLLRDIVNKTNIAEAKVGVTLAEVDMGQAAKDEDGLVPVKAENGDDDNGVGQLAALLTAEDRKPKPDGRKVTPRKSDAIQAILASAGVEYTHDNAEVVGTSKIEEQISRHAAMASWADDAQGQNALFAGSQDGIQDLDALHRMYNPPEDVQLRQFCEMAREFGFATAQDFALVVEGWTQEERRNCLDTFYKRRQEKITREAQSGLVREGGGEEVGKRELDDGPILPSVDVKAEDVKQESVKREAKDEVKDELKYEVKDEIYDEVKDETTDEVKREVKHEVKSEGADDVKHEVKDETKDGIKDEIKNEIKDEEVRSEIKSDVKDEAKLDLADVKHESRAKTEPEDVKMTNVKSEGESKRVSIFLMDDDDDDEL